MSGLPAGFALERRTEVTVDTTDRPAYFETESWKDLLLKARSEAMRTCGVFPDKLLCRSDQWSEISKEVDSSPGLAGIYVFGMLLETIG